MATEDTDKLVTAAPQIYEFCGETDRSLDNIRTYIRDGTASDDSMKSLLDRFVAQGLMYEEGGAFLSLALPRQPGL